MRKIEKEIYNILLNDGSLEKYVFHRIGYACPSPRFGRKLERIIENECGLHRSCFTIESNGNGNVKSYIYKSYPKRRINLYINNVRTKLARMCASYIVASNQIKEIVPSRKSKNPLETVCINDLYKKREENSDNGK